MLKREIWWVEIHIKWFGMENSFYLTKSKCITLFTHQKGRNKDILAKRNNIWWFAWRHVIGFDDGWIADQSLVSTLYVEIKCFKDSISCLCKTIGLYYKSFMVDEKNLLGISVVLRWMKIDMHLVDLNNKKYFGMSEGRHCYLFWK